MTDMGLNKILDSMQFCTNMNLSYNSLTDSSVDILISQKKKVPALKIINMAHNKINDRKVRNKLD